MRFIHEALTINRLVHGPCLCLGQEHQAPPPPPPLCLGPCLALQVRQVLEGLLEVLQGPLAPDLFLVHQEQRLVEQVLVVEVLVEELVEGLLQVLAQPLVPDPCLALCLDLQAQEGLLEVLAETALLVHRVLHR